MTIFVSIGIIFVISFFWSLISLRKKIGKEEDKSGLKEQVLFEK